MSKPYPRWQFGRINGEIQTRIITRPEDEQPDVWRESPKDLDAPVPAEFVNVDRGSPAGESAGPAEGDAKPDAPDGADDETTGQEEAPAPDAAPAPKKRGGRPRKIQE